MRLFVATLLQCCCSVANVCEGCLCNDFSLNVNAGSSSFISTGIHASKETRPKTAMCVPLRKNGNETGRESMRVVDRGMGTGREVEILLWKKIWESLGSQRRCLRGFLTNFRCSDLPKISTFKWTIQNIMTLTPPTVFWYWQSFHSLTKKCPWWW